MVKPITIIILARTATFGCTVSELHKRRIHGKKDLLCLLLPHIQRAPFPNLYKGPTEANNCLHELAFRGNCYMLASMLT